MFSIAYHNNLKTSKDMLKILKLHTYFFSFMRLSLMIFCSIASMTGTLLAYRSDAQEASNTIVTFTSKRLPLSRILQTVQNQSGFNLIYSPTQIDGDTVVEIPNTTTNVE